MSKEENKINNFDDHNNIINIIEHNNNDNDDRIKRRNRYYYLRRIKGNIKNFSINSKFDTDIINFITNKEKLKKSNLFNKDD